MALTIEDGTVVSDANSYVTLTEVKAYALARGVTLPDADADIEVMLIKAGDYLNTINNYKGDALEYEQSMKWPRANVIISLTAIGSDVIPSVLKKAQMQLVLHLADGVDIMPITTGNFVISEKVGPLETKYSESINTDPSPTLPLVDALLAPLLSQYKSDIPSTGFLQVSRA